MRNTKIYIKKLHPAVETPKKAHADDFCYDVYAVSEEEVAPNVWKYGLGFACQIVRPYAADGVSMAIDFRPRSSVWKTGMILSNCVGTIN